MTNQIPPHLYIGFLPGTDVPISIAYDHIPAYPGDMTTPAEPAYADILEVYIPAVGGGRAPGSLRRRAITHFLSLEALEELAREIKESWEEPTNAY